MNRRKKLGPKFDVRAEKDLTAAFATGNTLQIARYISFGPRSENRRDDGRNVFDKVLRSAEGLPPPNLPGFETVVTPLISAMVAREVKVQTATLPFPDKV